MSGKTLIQVTLDSFKAWKERKVRLCGAPLSLDFSASHTHSLTRTHTHAHTHTHTHTRHTHTELVSPSPPQLKEKKDKLNVSAARKKEAFVAGQFVAWGR